MRFDSRRVVGDPRYASAPAVANSMTEGASPLGILHLDRQRDAVAPQDGKRCPKSKEIPGGGRGTDALRGTGQVPDGERHTEEQETSTIHKETPRVSGVGTRGAAMGLQACTADHGREGARIDHTVASRRPQSPSSLYPDG